MSLTKSIHSVLHADVTKMSVLELSMLAVTTGRDTDAIRELFSRGAQGAEALAGAIEGVFLDGPHDASGKLKGAEKKAAEAGNRGISCYVKARELARLENAKYTIVRKGTEFDAVLNDAQPRARATKAKTDKKAKAKVQSVAESFAKAFRVHVGLPANADLNDMLAVLRTLPRGTVKSGKRVSATAKRAA